MPFTAFSLGTFFGCLPAVSAYVNAGKLGAEIVVNGAESSAAGRRWPPPHPLRPLAGRCPASPPGGSQRSERAPTHLGVPPPQRGAGACGGLSSARHLAPKTRARHRRVTPSLITCLAGNDLLLGVGVLATLAAISVAGNIASKALKEQGVDLSIES